MTGKEASPAGSTEASAVLLDRRVIAFRPPMLCAAMEAVGRRTLKLPPGLVQSAEMLVPEQAVRFSFGTRQPVTMQMASVALTSMLIAYCIGIHIPLPAQAIKTVTVTAGGVTLDFLIALQAPPRFDAALMRSRRVSGNW